MASSTSSSVRRMGDLGRRASFPLWVLALGLLVPMQVQAERTRAAGGGAGGSGRDGGRSASRSYRDSSPPIGSLRVAQASASAPPSASGDAVALFEYRNDVKQLADLVERLTLALQQNTSLSVINLVEARRRLGPQVDAEVARCDGETRCLTGVGEKLHAKEVLLLAVSQLGDVVLALQRIDVAEKRVIARYADSLSNGQGVDETRLLGWLQQLYPPEAFKRYGQIRISTDAEGSGAQVYVNAKPKGQTPLAEPLSVLAPGNYRLLIEKPRFLPFQAAVTVMPDTVVEVEARLQREAIQTPWYKRWYVWAGIGAGVAAVAATGLAIYFATDKPPPDMTRVPGTVVIR